MFHKWARYESWRQACERKGGWDMTGEGERDDKEVTCPPVISALFIMPSPSSRMSPVRLSVWHWYGSTSPWHKLLLWLVITLLQIRCTNPPKGCLHAPTRQPFRRHHPLRWGSGDDHIIWLRSVDSLSLQFLLLHQHSLCGHGMQGWTDGGQYTCSGYVLKCKNGRDFFFFFFLGCNNQLDFY